MRRFLILATALLAGGLLTACDDSTGTGLLSGLYTLVSINGEELPVELGDPIREIIAGSIQLNRDGTYSLSKTEDLGGGPATVTVFGTFTVDGSTVEFSGASTGTVSGNTLTVVDFIGDTLVYHK